MEIDIKYLSIQNPWWEGDDLQYDSVLSGYNEHKLKYHPKILDDIKLDKNFIYILRGPRGGGKTIILKLIIRDLIEKKKIDPENVLYYSCHNINSYEQLNEIIKVFLAAAKKRQNKERLYIFIDEVTLVKNWEKGIEYLRRAGLFSNAELVLSGSTLSDKKISEEYLKNKTYQEIIIPTLSFYEFLELLNPDLLQKINKKDAEKNYIDKLDYYLDVYFLTGGFISAINNYKEHGAVRQGVYSNFVYWLIADIAKMGRDLVLFRQVLEKVIFSLNKPLGYKTIAHKTKAKTHLTAEEYIKILEKMFVVKVLYQSDGDGGIKKSGAKKIFFLDPFLFWTFYSYIYGSLNYWQFSRNSLHEEELFNNLVKNIIFSHLMKDGSTTDWSNRITFWRDNIKKREIDFVVKKNKKITPILVCYNNEVTEQDKKVFEFAGFKEGIIVSKKELNLDGKIKIMPLGYFLLNY